MKQEYTNKEKEHLLDLIIEIAIEVHESGMTVAGKLGVPSHILWDLRQRSPRADMIGPCPCKYCDPNSFTD